MPAMKHQMAFWMRATWPRPSNIQWWNTLSVSEPTENDGLSSLLVDEQNQMPMGVGVGVSSFAPPPLHANVFG